jgi:hypothetical protein
MNLKSYIGKCVLIESFYYTCKKGVSAIHKYSVNRMFHIISQE